MRRASTLLMIKDDKALAVSRGNDLNDWGLPGGSVRDKETFEEAAIRELFEETGLRAYNLEMVYEQTHDGFHIQTFVPQDYFGDLTSSDEGEARWIDIDQLTKGTFGKYNAALLKHMGY